MSGLIFKYPLDLTGHNTTNRIFEEIHSLQGTGNRAVIPKFGAFYTASLIVTDTSTNTQLVAGEQYVPILYWDEPSEKSGLEVCAGIIITDTSVSNSVVITYQCVGGLYANISGMISDLINTLDIDNRPVSWGDLLDVPNAFPPVAHLHALGDIYGFEYIVDKLEAIRQAILIGDSAANQEIMAYINQRVSELNDSIDAITDTTTTHIDNKDNPHETTKAHVGLGNVDNYSRNDYDQRYAQQDGDYVNLRARSTTKTDVGLGNVDNYSRNDYDQRYAQQNGDYIDLRARGTTKTDVGLGNVDNYSRNDYDQRYAQQNGDYTSLRARATTKYDVGLGNVDNFATATKALAEAGISPNHFMTPLGVAQAIDALVEKTSWEVHGGDWGYIRHKPSGITIQWGSTGPLRTREAGRCGFRMSFTGRPWLVVPGNLTSTTTSNDRPDYFNETHGSVVNRSITPNNMVIAAQRIGGSGDDWTVVTWIAIGIVDTVSLNNESSRYTHLGSANLWFGGQIDNSHIGGFATGGGVTSPPSGTNFQWSTVVNGGGSTVYSATPSNGVAQSGNLIAFSLSIISGPDVAPVVTSVNATNINVEREGPNLFAVTFTMPSANTTINIGTSNEGPPPGGSPPPSGGDPNEPPPGDVIID